MSSPRYTRSLNTAFSRVQPSVFSEVKTNEVKTNEVVTCDNAIVSSIGARTTRAVTVTSSPADGPAVALTRLTSTTGLALKRDTDIGVSTSRRVQALTLPTTLQFMDVTSRQALASVAKEYKNKINQERRKIPLVYLRQELEFTAMQHFKDFKKLELKRTTRSAMPEAKRQQCAMTSCGCGCGWVCGIGGAGGVSYSIALLAGEYSLTPLYTCLGWLAGAGAGGTGGAFLGIGIGYAIGNACYPEVAKSHTEEKQLSKNLIIREEKLKTLFKELTTIYATQSVSPAASSSVQSATTPIVDSKKAKDQNLDRVAEFVTGDNLRARHSFWYAHTVIHRYEVSKDVAREKINAMETVAKHEDVLAVAPVVR